MRYEKGRKEETHRRIVDLASRRFRSDGVAAVGITEIMSAAGLTNGAFYAHFRSRDHLVRDALVDALRQQEATMAAVDATGDREAGIRAYLHPSHRDNPGRGCPSAALLTEIARLPNDTRQIYEDGLVRVIDLIAKQLPGRATAARRRRAMAIYGLLIGSLQLARAVRDAALSDEILRSGVEAALALTER